ncbi:uncharacterized protein [Maniola hyperantus]|uniref:uncharacterized protein isoform X1 n=1 Tax=Aphantopus hyperantus TaxID=2795564 RepID=UPI0037496540
MVRAVYHTLLLLCVTTHVNTQFFDFFSALQPIGQQTLRPLFQLDITTKRLRTTKTTRRLETTTKRNTPFSFYSDEFNRRTTKRPETTTKRNTSYSFYTDDLERDKQKTKNAPIVHDFFSTTTKPTRKTTKSNPSRRHYDPNTRDNVNIDSNISKIVSKETNNNSNNRNNKSKTINNSRNVNVHSIQKAQQSSQYNNDRLIFDDDGRRNTVINYETTKPIHTTKYPNLYETNRKTSTSRPYTIRPGVKPAVVNGPPITNRPATQRPSFGPQGLSDDVSPELIIGPNEDYMSTVEKKRYIEIAEKMCDKYKALDIHQIQAIPLVPSPDPVRVNVSTCIPHEVALVVGGRVASIQEFRHMALLGWNKIQTGGYSWKCGGSLISSQFVLTAAHCAYQDRDNSVIIGPPQVVQLGSSYLDDPGAVVVRVAAVIRHPKYKLPKSYYDIALVKMANTVTFSSVIKPACLGIPPPTGKPIIATGWGRTEFGGDQSQELRSVSLPVWDMAECYNVLGTSRRLPEGPSSDSQICAGEKKGGKDTCQGDSGGPAQIQEGCSWRVVAVTSVGRSCGAAQTPALYAKVPRAFISSVVFAGQTDNNNQNSNNNNNQQWNNQQTNNNNGNKTPQWNTNQQQSNNGQQNNNNQPWNNNQWNNQQQSNNNRQPTNNQQNWNNNQGNSWNRHQGEPSRNPDYNNQPQNNNQWHSNQGTNNNRNNQNIKRDDQDNNYDVQNGNSNVYQSNNQNNRNNGQYNRGQSNNGYTTDKPVYNQQGGYNNGHTVEKPVYNQQGGYNVGYTTEKPVYNQQGGYNVGYTTEKPVYNQQSGYNTGYTTEKPVYNQQGGYNNGHTVEKPVYNQQGGYNVGYTTEKPVYNQQGGYNVGYTTEKPVYNQQGGYNVGYTTVKPVYNQQGGYNNGYTTEKPVYNQNGGYYSGDYDAVVPSGYQNDGRVWWT